MFSVARCADEWVSGPAGSFRALRACLQGNKGTKRPGGAVAPPKVWARKRKELCTAEEVWYCVCCGFRIQNERGVLVEARVDGLSTFVLARVSRADIED
eukprot:935984-Alexandrium_andersonii.AAC.1